MEILRNLLNIEIEEVTFTNIIKSIVNRILLCVFILWILAVCVGFIFVYLPRETLTESPTTQFTDDSDSAPFNLNYKSNIISNDSLTVTDLTDLANQIAQKYSASKNIIRVFSARFIQSLIFTKRKRQINTVNNNVTNETDDFFVIEFEIKYPPTCGGVKICNDHFTKRMLLTIESAQRLVNFRISFTNGIILNTELVFESVNRTITTDTTTTTIQTSTTVSAALPTTSTTMVQITTTVMTTLPTTTATALPTTTTATTKMTQTSTTVTITLPTTTATATVQTTTTVITTLPTTTTTALPTTTTTMTQTSTTVTITLPTTTTTMTTKTTTTLTTSTTSNPYVCSNMTILIGFDMQYYDLLMINGTTFSSCCDLCLSNTKCLGYTWAMLSAGTVATYCFLKSTIPTPKTNAFVVSAHY
ncbi:hypothetical protein I4U23_011533 [Adineta vaga]|nr:hypothetical protein I4U23_011533 [Adineta vaga]